MPRPGPVERLRRRLEKRSGAAAARLLPTHYQRLGRVVLVRWPEALRPEFPFLSEGLASELGVETIARFDGPAEGTRRLPNVERLFGGSTETEVLEDGVRFRFDAARQLYSRGNRTERARFARLVRPDERVADLFAGIGYFALPAARHGRPIELLAVEENPESYRFLLENVRINHLEGIIHPIRGDNRTVELPLGQFDRVVLGYLPDAMPWVPRGLALLRPEGGWLHVHHTGGSRTPLGASAEALRTIVSAAGRSVATAAERMVKPYGPGREHRVTDVRIGPR